MHQDLKLKNELEEYGLIKVISANMSRLKISGGRPYPPLLDFDGSTYVSLGSQVDASMNKIITFNLYIESSTHDFGDSIIRFPNSQVDDFNIYFSSLGKIQLYTNNYDSTRGGFTKTITSDMLKRQLYFEVGKAEGTFKFLKMNGILQENEGGTNGSGGSPAFGGQASIIMQNAALWDIRIYDYDSSAFTGTGSLMHHWRGYPRGETNAAWEDLVGNVNGTVQGGNPTPKAREIPGFYSEADWPTGNKLKFKELISIPGTGMDWQLSVIRNQEMDNTVGDAGSTNLHVSNIAGNTLTVPNLPSYSKFYETNTWAVKNTSVNGTAVLCTSINDVAKTITLTSASGFSIGTRISIFNPYLNYNFSGDQSTGPSIPADGGTAWMSSETGGGTILPPKNGIKRWLFFGNNGAVNSMGLATSSDWKTWDVSNGKKPVLMAAEVPGSPTSIYSAGGYVMVDNSICCMLGTNNGARIMCFSDDVSSFTFTPIIPASGVSAPGGLAKIGNYYHILIMDTSSGVAQRQIQALKSLNIEGPYTKYQDIIYGAQAPFGTAWDWICDMPVIINDGVKIFGIFGGQAQATSLGSGVGYINRQGILLDFDSDTETWSINSKGPAFINPIDWPGSPWYYDHVGAAISTYIDGSIMYMGATFKGYAATMLKLENFNSGSQNIPSNSNKLTLGDI